MASICLAFGLPLGGLVYVGADARAEQIDDTNTERAGLELLVPTVALLEAQLELEANAAIGPGAGTAEQLARTIETRDRLARQLDDIDTDLRQRADVAEAFDEVQRALAVEGAGELADDTASAPVAAIVALIDAVGRSANLTQDPDLDTYYLVVTAVGTLPRMLESSSNLTRLGVDALRSASFTSEVRTRLIALTTALEDDMRTLVSHASTAASASPAQTDPVFHDSLTRVGAVTTQLVDAGEKLGRDFAVKPTPEEVRALGAESAAASFVLFTNLLSVLDERLADRISGLVRDQLALGALGVGVVVVIVAVLVVTAADLRARRAAEAALVHQAAHDPLTGLANRRLFHERLRHACAAAGRTGVTVGVIYLDLDDFKVVNDRLGHEAGDDLLREVATRIRRTIRTTDTPARLGGDEFAIVLDHLRQAEDAELVARALLQALRDPVDVSGRHVAIHASIGVTIASAASDADALVAAADAAMYRAKQHGKGSIEVTDSSSSGSEPRLQLSDLDDALAQDQLVLHYQPIVSVEGARVLGVEALLRWAHPDVGLVSPALFVPYAERTDLIVPIGRWVLDAACRQAAEWRQLPGHGDLFVTVNVSGRQLLQDLFIDDVRAALAASGLPPAALVVEVTESTTLAGRDDVCGCLDAIRALGVRVAIDDFGTGYTSIAYLSDLPVDIVKLDKSFIDGLGRPGANELARTMIDLVKRLGYDAIAEGIETTQQAELVSQFGCATAQGYLFAHPADAAVISSTLRDRAPAAFASTSEGQQ